MVDTVALKTSGTDGVNYRFERLELLERVPLFEPLKGLEEMFYRPVRWIFIARRSSV